MLLSFLTFYPIHYRTERLLDDSGITVHPPKRSTTKPTTDVETPIQVGRLRRSDVVPEGSEEEENEEEDGESQEESVDDEVCVFVFSSQ